MMTPMPAVPDETTKAFTYSTPAVEAPTSAEALAEHLCDAASRGDVPALRGPLRVGHLHVRHPLQRLQGRLPAPQELARPKVCLLYQTTNSLKSKLISRSIHQQNNLYKYCILYPDASSAVDSL